MERSARASPLARLWTLQRSLRLLFVIVRIAVRSRSGLDSRFGQSIGGTRRDLDRSPTRVNVRYCDRRRSRLMAWLGQYMTACGGCAESSNESGDQALCGRLTLNVTEGRIVLKKSDLGLITYPRGAHGCGERPPPACGGRR